ncbi:hypothetical protein [Nocardioides bigeumensis]|uniref:Uncharacterized protein n=1 Tax=Nocardioides bigeumensis TaxID=433657 RepID=A0ABN2Y4V0_9ACTN
MRSALLRDGVTGPAPGLGAPLDRDDLRTWTADVQLWWIPLGAGGSPVVHASGLLYEALSAWRQHRPAAALFHSALRVVVEDVAFVIEVAPAWSRPAPDARSIMGTGAVGATPLGSSRWFRYEIRRWPHGVIPDQDYAVSGPTHLSDDPRAALQLLALVAQCPTPVWGRDQLRTGEMWNSNSVVAWLLACSGIDPGDPPGGGRAPGWDAGIELARRQNERERR